MELRFTTPQLARLDLAGTDVLVAGLSVEDRPPRGVAGLVDWRLAGRVSRLVASGFVTGARGEVLMIPGRPKLPFEKVLLFGVGRRDAFDEAAFVEIVDAVLETLEGLQVRTAVVELPGRHFGGISAERAAETLLDRAGARPEHDSWTLVESMDSQRAIRSRMVQERRRVR